jgi:predicted Zn-dependent protease
VRRRAPATLVLTLLLVACATSPLGRKQLALMPESEMRQMGLQAFASIKKETPIDHDAQANAYVDCVANAITREVGGNWEVVVFRDDAANAFALPGGKIGVNTGMLKVAHVLAEHSNERVSQQFAVESGLALVQALGNPRSATGSTMMGLLGVGAQYGILLPYSRIQESEADLYGLDIMARAGFDPQQSIDLWVNMEKAGAQGPPEFLSTHPSHNTRIRDLKARIPHALCKPG